MALLDPASPLAWLAALVLGVSGAACAWLGVRDGFLRRRMRTSGGELTGGAAAAWGAVYVAFGLAGVAGLALFLARAAGLR